MLGNGMFVDRKIDFDSKNVKTYNLNIITSCTPLVWTNLKMLNLSLLQNWSCNVYRTSWTINSVQYDLLALQITNIEITVPTKCLLYINISTNKQCNLYHVTPKCLGVHTPPSDSLQLCELKLWIITMIKYSTVVCCYDKILLNVAAHVIPG